ncbi:MAG: DUF222 domain-containing protein [Candidatus Nanopelagicales bacterium]
MPATQSDPHRDPARPDTVGVPSVDLGAPCAGSLGVLTAVDPLLIPAGARLDLLVELERHAAWLEAVRLSVVAAVAGPGPNFADIDDRLADPAESLWDVAVTEDTIRDEIATALHISGRAADRRIDLARDLEHKLPATRALLKAGKCTYQHANVIAEECVNVSVRDACAVEDRALGRVESQTPSQTRRSVRAAIAAICPQPPEEVIEEEFARRDVALFHDGGVMATLVATLPAPDAIAVWNALTAVAHKDNDPDDPRTRAHKRADALTAWAHQAGDDPDLPVMQGRKRLETQVVIDAATLLGFTDTPAELVGYGPIPAWLGRRLAADSDAWRRLVTDPITGHLLDYGHNTYTPPASLRDYVIARDRGCQFPGCAQPSHRCDLDHVQPFTASPDGGLTSADNLISLCRRHHLLKTHHRWQVRVLQPPDGQTGKPPGEQSRETIIEWTSPRGRIHRQPRPPQLQPLPLPRPDQQDAPPDVDLRPQPTASPKPMATPEPNHRLEPNGAREPATDRTGLEQRLFDAAA